jgi:hypothetical protein
VWARVLFGPDGKPIEYTVVDEASYPAKFVDNVKARVARATIPPPLASGRPATLRTGVALSFLIAPNVDGGTVRMQGINMGPIPTKKYFASYPEDVGSVGGWEGAASATCVVGALGRCTSIQVRALPGMPESVRRYMRVSLESWEFEPQLLDGAPIEGEYTLSIKFETLDNRPRDNFPNVRR